MAESDDIIKPRSRSLTEKGEQYRLERSQKRYNSLFADLKNVGQNINDKLSSSNVCVEEVVTFLAQIRRLLSEIDIVHQDIVHIDPRFQLSLAQTGVLNEIHVIETFLKRQIPLSVSQIPVSPEIVVQEGAGHPTLATAESTSPEGPKGTHLDSDPDSIPLPDNSGSQSDVADGLVINTESGNVDRVAIGYKSPDTELHNQVINMSGENLDSSEAKQVSTSVASLHSSNQDSVNKPEDQSSSSNPKINDNILQDLMLAISSINNGVSNLDSRVAQVNSVQQNVIDQVNTVRDDLVCQQQQVKSQLHTVILDQVNTARDDLVCQQQQVKDDLVRQQQQVKDDLVCQQQQVKGELHKVILDQVNSVNKSVDAIKTDMSHLRADFQLSIESMQTEIKGVLSSVGKLKDSVQIVENRLKSTEAKQGDLDQRLMVLSENYKFLASTVSSITPSTFEHTVPKTDPLNFEIYSDPTLSKSLFSASVTAAPAAKVSLSPDGVPTDTYGSNLNLNHSQSEETKQEHQTGFHFKHLANNRSLNPDHFAQSLSRAMKQSRAPPPTPSVFKGEPTAYPAWKRSMISLLEQEDNEADKLSHLQKYLSPELQQQFKGYLQYPDVASCEKVLDQLDKQFNDKHKVCMSFWLELENWPNIKHNDGPALQSFANHLIQMNDIALTNSRLNFLNEPYTLKILIDKLPNSLASSFRSEANKWKKSHDGEYPSFDKFVNFVVEKSESENDAYLGGGRQSNTSKATNPVSKTVLSTDTSEVLQASSDSSVTNEVLLQAIRVMTNTTNVSNRLVDELKRQQNPDFSPKKTPPEGYCPCCVKHPHTVDKCRFFLSLEPCQRIVKSIDLKLCLLCLKARHISKDCESGLKCEHCQRNHNSLLHHADCMQQIKDELTKGKSVDSPNKGNSSTNSENHHSYCASCTVAKDPTALLNNYNKRGPAVMSTMIVPVYVSSKNNPIEQLCYAMLDTMSDATFIKDDIALKTESRSTNTVIMVDTINQKQSPLRCRRHYDLQIRGVNSDKRIHLSDAYSKESLEVNRDHIPG